MNEWPTFHEIMEAFKARDHEALYRMSLQLERYSVATPHSVEERMEKMELVTCGMIFLSWRHTA